MKLFVLFTLALSTSAYEGYHDQHGNQQRLEYTYLDANARSHCARGGKQLCATNGKEYVLFENACQLEAQNLRRLFAGESDLVQTSFHYCNSDYDHQNYDQQNYDHQNYDAPQLTGPYESNSAQNAICARFKHQQKTFDDIFALHEESAATGKDWQLVSFGPCKHASSYPENSGYSASYASHKPSESRTLEALSFAYATPNYKPSYSRSAASKSLYYEDVQPVPYQASRTNYQANGLHQADDDLFDYKPLEYQSHSKGLTPYQTASTSSYQATAHRENFDYLFDFPQPIAHKSQQYNPVPYQSAQKPQHYNPVSYHQPAAFQAASVPRYQAPAHHKTLDDLYDFPAPPKPSFYEPVAYSGTNYQPAHHQPSSAFYPAPAPYHPTAPFFSSLEHVAPYYPPPPPAVYHQHFNYPHLPSHPYAYTYKGNGTVGAFASISYNDYDYYAKNTTIAPPTVGTTTTEFTTTTESTTAEPVTTTQAAPTTQ